jgi:phosphoribosylanthranilate isomerase
MRTRIKICCISSEEEARMAIHAGADALGLVGKMPSGPGPIENEMISTIRKIIPPPLASFLLTSEQSAEGIINHIRSTQTNTIQIVDAVGPGTYKEIRYNFPHMRIVQVVHVSGAASVNQALEISQLVDAILLDSGDPTAPIRTLGGTGNVHDWQISREIVKAVTVPVFLAGGLNAENVGTAIQTVRPFAVDVCSGVRTNGKLDRQKLMHFISAVQGTIFLETGFKEPKE